MDTPRPHAFWQWLWVATTAIAGTCIFFYGQISSGFARLFGDHYDGFIELAIMQHWKNVLHGDQAWNVAGYFYPYADTLGYNDGYFLYGMLYALYRGLGADALLSGELVHMTIKAAGAVGMYLLLRFGVRCRMGASLLGALLSTIASNSFIQAGHGQLFLVGFAPFGAFLLWSFFRAVAAGAGRRAYAYGIGFGAFYGVWLLTAYYMAWYFGFFVSVVCIFAVATVGKSGRQAWLATLQAQWRPILAAGCAFVLGVLPFLVVYLPKLRETGGHSWRNTMYYALRPIDVINVGEDNLVWGGAFRWLHTSLVPKLEVGAEFAVGIPPLLLLLGVAGIVAIARRYRSTPLFWAALAVIVTWLMAFNYGRPQSFSPWELVFKLFPGGKGTRVIARYQIFLTLPIIVFAMHWLDGLRGRSAGLVIALAAFLVVEELNLRPQTYLERHEELAMIADVPPMPAACESFYIVSARSTPYPTSGDDALYAHNADAMFLAGELARPTVIGFSTFNPKDWNFRDPAAADYHARVQTYLRKHQLSHVCYLDRARAPAWQEAGALDP